MNLTEIDEFHASSIYEIDVSNNDEDKNKTTQAANYHPLSDGRKCTKQKQFCGLIFVVLLVFVTGISFLLIFNSGYIY